ncbi:MAG TPA: acyltransferase [Burkholderiaceae bacterium]|nr:acyltransferase [Burkholderiaceae bacterium]
MAAQTKRSGRIAGLDGLRALAVISVVLTHYGVFAGLEQSAVLPLVHGLTGVRAFFVLSGFLITRLLLQEYEQNGRISYPNFIARRALRIFPLYFLFLVLASLLFMAGYWRTTPGGLVYAWLYVYNFVPPSLYDPVLAHTWSLAVEEHFYLLWPLALILLVRSDRALVGFIVVVALASFLSFVVLTHGLGVKGYFLERWTVVAAYSLLVGCLAAKLAQLGAETPVAGFCASTPSLFVAAILFATPALVHMVPALAERVLPGYTAAAAQSLGIATFILWVSAHPDSRIVAALEFPPLRYVGTISYGIYIWQGFFLAVSPYRSPDSSWPPSPALGLLGIAVFAPLSYHFFEKRFLAMKERYKAVAPASVGAPGLRTP